MIARYLFFLNFYFCRIISSFFVYFFVNSEATEVKNNFYNLYDFLLCCLAINCVRYTVSDMKTKTCNAQG